MHDIPVIKKKYILMCVCVWCTSEIKFLVIFAVVVVVDCIEKKGGEKRK